MLTLCINGQNGYFVAKLRRLNQRFTILTVIDLIGENFQGNLFDIFLSKGLYA